MSENLLTRRSIRFQMAAVFGAVAVVLALILSTLFGGLITSQIERERSAVLQGIARGVANSLGEGIQERARQVELLADAGELWAQGLDSRQVQQALTRSRASRPFAAWVGVANLDGVVKGASDGVLVGGSVAQRPWFQQARRGTFVGDVHSALLLASRLPHNEDKAPLRLLDFAAPIRRDGEVIGVIGMHGNWTWIQHVAATALPVDAADQQLELFIRARDGSTLYPATGATLTPAPPPSANATAAANPAGGSTAGAARVTTWADGRSYLTSWSPLPGAGQDTLGWTVVARQPTVVAFAEARRVQQRVLVIGALAALLAAAVAWFAAGIMSQPLAAIARVAGRIGAGDHTHAIPTYSSSRELQQFSTALAAMTGRLIEANEQLEQRIAERTRELQAANAGLQRLSAQQQAMLDNEMVGIMLVDQRWTRWTNRAMERMFGYGPGELLDRSGRLLYRDDSTYERIGLEAHAVLAQGGSYRTQVELRRRNGEPIWIDLNGTRLAPDSTESLWMLIDITAQKRHEREVERIAFHDVLTGLPNRMLLLDRLQFAITHNLRERRQVAVAFVDLDGFKEVNDRHGHDAGDAVLRIAAARMKTCVRGDDTVARLGGDEFVILLPSLEGEPDCLRVLQRVVDALGAPFHLEQGGSARISASIGVALSPQHGSEASLLLTLADNAMHGAKQAGKNQVRLHRPGPRAAAAAAGLPG